jgi:hypothetical protein
MGGVISAVGRVVDGAIGTDIAGDKAYGRALDAQGNARDQANYASEQAWKRQQEEMAPWKALGTRALASLESGDFMKNDPGVAFRMEQGQKAIDAGLAARGMANSGAALKELARYGQNFGSQEYNNAWNRQNALANYGNQASTALGNYAGGHGANLANNAIGYGNAAAGSIMGQRGEMNNTFNGLLQGGAMVAGAMSGKGK